MLHHLQTILPIDLKVSFRLLTRLKKAMVSFVIIVTNRDISNETVASKRGKNVDVLQELLPTIQEILARGVPVTSLTDPIDLITVVRETKTLLLIIVVLLFDIIERKFCREPEKTLA